jgi:hypothetical protein
MRLAEHAIHMEKENALKISFGKTHGKRIFGKSRDKRTRNSGMDI